MILYNNIKIKFYTFYYIPNNTYFYLNYIETDISNAKISIFVEKKNIKL